MAPSAAPRCSSGSVASFAVMPAWNFSHTRGTAKKTVGRQSARSRATVSRLSANHTSHPMEAWANSDVMRSAMWLSGR